METIVYEREYYLAETNKFENLSCFSVYGKTDKSTKHLF